MVSPANVAFSGDSSMHIQGPFIVGEGWVMVVVSLGVVVVALSGSHMEGEDERVSERV